MTDKLKHTPGKLELYNDDRDEYQNGGLVIDGKEFWGGYDSSMPSDDDIEALTMAWSAPHDCFDPKCPGAANRRKLEAAEGLVATLDRLHGQCECHATAPNKCYPCEIRAALTEYEADKLP